MDDDIKKAMGDIKRSLEESFGAGMTARILFSARDAVSASLIGMTREKFIDLIRAVCSDSRVKELWGDFGVKERLSRWEKLMQ